MDTITKEMAAKIKEESDTTLRLLGLNSSYKGFDYLIYGIGLVLETPDILTYVCKGLYLETAINFGTTVGCAERNIRTAREAVWKNGSEGLRIQIFGERYQYLPPNNSQFVDALAHYIKKQVLQKECNCTGVTR